MNPQKLTPWYSAGTKPARVGVYETRTPGRSRNNVYQFWDGNYWNFLCISVAQAADEASKGKSFYQNEEWRGFAQKGENP